MTTANQTYIDTDIQIHRRSPDPPVREAAQKEFIESRPTAMSAFTMVELKGSYFQRLILLREKVSKSDSLGSAQSRVKNSGGRHCGMMLEQLGYLLNDQLWEADSWEEAQRILLIHIDAQIEISWEEFLRSVDKVADDFQCTRATEEPVGEGGKWKAKIPKCRTDNTSCTIVGFMEQYKAELNLLIQVITELTPELKTKELNRIREAAERTVRERFPWENNICRKVGDLLIGLQSRVGKELLSSNYKDHDPMHEPLGYEFRKFPLVEIRSK